MAQLTNKCSDDDIDYYIKECGDILGVSQQISNADDPKAILHYIFQEIVKYKSSQMSWNGGSPRNGGGLGYDAEDNASNKAFHEQTDNSYTDL